MREWEHSSRSWEEFCWQSRNKSTLHEINCCRTFRAELILVNEQGKIIKFVANMPTNKSYGDSSVYIQFEDILLTITDTYVEFLEERSRTYLMCEDPIVTNALFQKTVIARGSNCRHTINASISFLFKDIKVDTSHKATPYFTIAGEHYVPQQLKLIAQS